MFGFKGGKGTALRSGCLLTGLMLWGALGLYAQSSPLITIEDVTDPIILSPLTGEQDVEEQPEEAVAFTAAPGGWLIRASSLVLSTEVLDRQGHPCFKSTQPYQQARLDARQLPEGTFTLRVSTAQGTEVLRWQQR